MPEGTWMVSLKVEDDQLWQEIKAGKYKGFSIEGLFKFKKSSRKVKQECSCGEAEYRDWETDRKSTRLNSSHRSLSRMPSSA